MRNNVKEIIANKGYQTIIPAITNTIRDLKQCKYEYLEIKETIRDSFFGIDPRLDEFIINEGY